MFCTAHAQIKSNLLVMTQHNSIVLNILKALCSRILEAIKLLKLP